VVFSRRMALTIRRAESSDLPRVETLLKRADLPALDPHPLLANLLVAEDGEGPIGAVVLEVSGRAGLVRAIVVEESRRGQGVGRELMRSLMARAAELGLKQLYAIAHASVGFLEALGFDAAAPDPLPLFVREARRRGGGEAAPLLQRRLR
jgi:amino-acid N-acetyltransferase